MKTSKRLVCFNHKGGVSKTTSVYNISWMLAKKYKVLIVDADPQCNLTSLILGENFEKYYFDSSTATQNIKDGVSVAFSGKPYPIEAVHCVSPERAPNLKLLAGHANLSEYDASLTFAQTANNAITTLQNLPGAFSQLMKLTEERYDIDYTLIDLNPGLSAINQNLFLSANAFVVPTNPDPFSLMAVDTLRKILPRWVEWKRNSIDLFKDSAYPLLPGEPKFLGSLIQRFNIRNGRAAKPYRDNIEEIKEKISGDFFNDMSQAKMTLQPTQYEQALLENHYCFNEIPDFQGLLPKSYAAGVPVYDLRDGEIGEVGNVLTGLQEKRALFHQHFSIIANSLVHMLANA